MAIAYLCDPDRDLAISVWDGTVGPEEWLSHLRQLRQDPGFLSTWKHLVDMRFGATDPSFGAATIQEAVDYLIQRQSVIAGRRVAIMTGAEQKKARLFQDLAESAQVEVRVFADLRGASEWLGIDPAKAEDSIARLRETLLREV